MPKQSFIIIESFDPIGKNTRVICEGESDPRECWRNYLKGKEDTITNYEYMVTLVEAEILHGKRFNITNYRLLRTDGYDWSTCLRTSGRLNIAENRTLSLLKQVVNSIDQKQDETQGR